MSKNRLKCCGRNVQILYTVPLFDTEKQLHRELVVGRCKNPNCGVLKAQIIYWDKDKQTFQYQKIPQKDIAKTIEAYKKSPYLTNINQPIKQGSKENMFWKYHERNGIIKDFNGIRVNNG